MPSQLTPRGGPYVPTTHSAGGVPSVLPDVPISVCLLVAFFFVGSLHMRRFITNKKRGHKFPPNAMVFGLGDVRLITFSLRTAWACYPDNIHVGIVSTLFVYAGIILLFLAQLFFTQRIIRSQHPRLGWSRPFSLLFVVFYALIIVSLVMVITVVVQSFFTLDDHTHYIDHGVQLYALSFYLFISFAPIPLLLFSTLISLLQHKSPFRAADPFGRGSLAAKMLIVIFSALVLTLGAGYRLASNSINPVPLLDEAGSPLPSPWYLSRASFYGFNFATEFVIVVVWYFARIEQRFYIPDGAEGSYAVLQHTDDTSSTEEAGLVGVSSSATGTPPTTEKVAGQTTAVDSSYIGDGASSTGASVFRNGTGSAGTRTNMASTSASSMTRSAAGVSGNGGSEDDEKADARDMEEARWTGRAWRDGNVIYVNAIADDSGEFAMRDAQSIRDSGVSWDDLPGLTSYDFERT